LAQCISNAVANAAGCPGQACAGEIRVRLAPFGSLIREEAARTRSSPRDAAQQTSWRMVQWADVCRGDTGAAPPRPGVDVACLAAEQLAASIEAPRPVEVAGLRDLSRRVDQLAGLVEAAVLILAFLAVILAILTAGGALALVRFLRISRPEGGGGEGGGKPRWRPPQLFGNHAAKRSVYSADGNLGFHEDPPSQGLRDRGLADGDEPVGAELADAFQISPDEQEQMSRALPELMDLTSHLEKKVPRDVLRALARVRALHRVMRYEVQPPADIQRRLSDVMARVDPELELFWHVGDSYDKAGWYNYVPPGPRPAGRWQIKKINLPGLKRGAVPLAPAHITVG
jgi:hypothetical protein